MILNFIGLYTTISILAKLYLLFRPYISSSKLSRYAHPSLNGAPPWAMVTGASDGIGYALVEELAHHGFNVVLHGRNPEKLAKRVAELQSSFPDRSFKAIVADANNVACASCLKTHREKGLGREVALDFAEIKKDLEGLHLTVLINNVGGNPVGPVYVPLKDKDEVKLTENVSLNALFPLHLIRTLLPTLIQNGPSLLINVSSMADQGLPFLASYSASKQFLMTLTSTLRLEVMLEGRADDVEILGVRTGRVTGVTDYKEPPSFFVPDTKTFAKATLAHAGHGRGLVVGYWTHMLQDLMASLMPPWVADRVRISFMRQLEEGERMTKKEI
ncbi:NAD(P)-binding protein [Hypomontagnella monticulosa]|nr:NAD(P)-binding protein [Hypomontagnella monticulosa]